MKKRIASKQVIFAIISLVLGFILAFSYSAAREKLSGAPPVSNRQYLEEEQLRADLIEIQEKNRELQQELFIQQDSLREREQEFSKDTQVYRNMVEDAEKLRMFLGKVKVSGAGVNVTLEDAEYDPSDPNVNNYIVHERHVFKVINELYIAGASAVAINGQRISHQSYIVCTGPVITVDGVQHPAPFVISAIGDADVLLSALNLVGGVKDQLVNDQIVVKLEQNQNLTFDAVFRES